MCFDVAYCWSSRHLFDVVDGTESDDGDDGDEDPVGEFIVKTIGHLEFPSLKRAIIFFDDIPYPDFLSQTRAPFLERLDLQCPTWDNFSPSQTLKVLHIAVSGDYIGSASEPPFTRLIPTQTLTTLSLRGNCFNNLSFQPNSIHFPALDTLTLCVKVTNGFMRAIVAPNLECLTYVSLRDENPSSVIFAGLGSKFTRVRRFYYLVSREIDQYDHSPLCEAFPNVCHAEFNPQDLTGLFTGPRHSTGTICRPIDLWRNLKSLAVGNLGSESLKALKLLTNWLIQRRNLGLPLLHVKMTRFLASDFRLLYGSLRDHCLLEFEGSRMKKAHLSKLADSSPWMVSIPCLSGHGKFIYLQHLGTDLSSELISNFTSSFLESNFTRD